MASKMRQASLIMVMGIAIGISLPLLALVLSGQPILFYIRQDKAGQLWTQYLSSEKQICCLPPNAARDRAVDINTRSFNALVQMGELKQYEFAASHPILAGGVLYGILNEQSSRAYRHGLAIVGGQWAPGRFYLERRVLAYVESRLSSLPQSFGDVDTHALTPPPTPDGR